MYGNHQLNWRDRTRCKKSCSDSFDSNHPQSNPNHPNKGLYIYYYPNPSNQDTRRKPSYKGKRKKTICAVEIKVCFLTRDFFNHSRWHQKYARFEFGHLPWEESIWGYGTGHCLFDDGSITQLRLGFALFSCSELVLIHLHAIQNHTHVGINVVSVNYWKLLTATKPSWHWIRNPRMKQLFSINSFMSQFHRVVIAFKCYKSYDQMI